MHLSKYAALANASHETYEFLSSGPKGTIKKVVKYTEIQPGVFNLGFGDWDEVEQKVKDNARTNNADRDIVLATVASTVVDFMRYHPGAILFAQGETPAKTRLYLMGINANWHEISQLFTVQGFAGGDWEPFEQGRNYEAFTLKAK
jgi:hypothetical protein